MAEIPGLDAVRQLIVNRVRNLKEISLAIGMKNERGQLHEVCQANWGFDPAPKQ